MLLVYVVTSRNSKLLQSVTQHVASASNYIKDIIKAILQLDCK